MNLRRKILYIFVLFTVLFLLFSIKSYAGTQRWNSLDYNVKVNTDGSMDVVETWDISISETNTIFKDFDIDYRKYSGITNVRVSQIKNNEEIYLEQIYEEQYHVDNGCYYALPLSSNYNKFEIAWNVGLDNSSGTRTYKLYYRIEDAVKIYEDCTELYWMFLGTDNAISGKNVTGTIKLPKTVSNIENLRVWAHGPLEGTINRDSEDTIKFSLDKLNTRTMLEVRIVTEENIYEECTNYSHLNSLESILKEEQGWADEANRQREESKLFIENLKKSIAIFIIINIIIVFLFSFKKKKYKQMGKELEQTYASYDYDIEYFREIPNEENATPARAVYMHDFKYNSSNISYKINKIFSATILDLSLKGLVEFEPINKDEVKIILKENKNITLPEDENVIYEILEKAVNGKGYTTVKEFTKYSKNNYDDVYTKLQKLEKIVKVYEQNCGNIDKEKDEVLKYWKKKRNKYILLIIFAVCFIMILLPLFGIYIGLLICLSQILKNIKKIPLLSEKGNREAKEWRALKKYMKDYSLLKEKKVPDIVLWEKFLVYATAFGISKEVIKQLKLVHPEMFEINDTQNMHRYAYWYMISDSRYGDNYFNNFNSNLGNVYEKAASAYSIANSNYSSGSGGGGGFSSGGGGRRRSAEAVADANKI